VFYTALIILCFLPSGVWGQSARSAPDSFDRLLDAIAIVESGNNPQSRGDGGKAVADGQRVVIGIDFPAFAYPEDDVFAAVVAHELAHNVLEHDAWLDRNGRRRRHVRLTERAADRLMPWLLANAGYDPAAAVTFMTRWGSRHDAGLRVRRGHEGWDERAKAIAAEVPAITALLAQAARADWGRHFRREIDPAAGLLRTAKR
jgi:hypothetical protein